jgi:hypothetical protein
VANVRFCAPKADILVKSAFGPKATLRGLSWRLEMFIGSPVLASPADLLDLPSGRLLTGVSSLFSDFPKNISVPTYPKSKLYPSMSRPTEGRFAIVTNVGHGMRWTRQRFARDELQGGLAKGP